MAKITFGGNGKPKKGDKFNCRINETPVPGKGYPILGKLGQLLAIAVCDQNLADDPRYQNVQLCGGGTTNTAQNVGAFHVENVVGDGWEEHIC